MIERWREQQHEPVAATNQVLLHSRHRVRRALFICRARNYSPGLGDGINPAVIALCRAERRAVIEISATVPITVPGVLKRGLQLAHMQTILRGALLVSA